MVNSLAVNICFSQYDNDSLRIDLASTTFELLMTCTTQTNEIEDFKDIRGFTETKNNEIRMMHAYNLIIAVNTKHSSAISILIERGVIQAKPVYYQNEGNQMLAFYALTRYAIEQKCKIIDEEEFLVMSLKDMEEILPGVKDINNIEAEWVYKRNFLYKRKIF